MNTIPWISDGGALIEIFLCENTLRNWRNGRPGRASIHDGVLFHQQLGSFSLSSLSLFLPTATFFLSLSFPPFLSSLSFSLSSFLLPLSSAWKFYVVVSFRLSRLRSDIAMMLLFVL